MHQIANGHTVTLVHGRDYDPQYLASVPEAIKKICVPSLVHKIDFDSDFRCALALHSLYKAEGFDVVHTHQSKAGVIGRLATIGLRKTIVVHTVHIAPFLSVDGPTRGIYLMAEKLGAAVSHRIINVSEGMRDACLEFGVGAPGKHVVIQSGMHIEKFKKASIPTNWRARLGGWTGCDQPKVLVMLAAFEPRKRQRQLIEAIEPYLSLRDDVCLVFAGQGICLSECKTLVGSLHLDDKIKFVGHVDDPQSLIALADVCLLTSEREGLPRVVVQYLAGGKPVVLMSLPGIEEVVTNGTNGIIVEANSFHGFCQSLFNLIGDEQELKKLTDGAAATNVSKWAVESMGDRIMTVYSEALSSRHAA